MIGVVDKCKNWGLGTPEYYPETSDFKTIIWRRGFGPNAVSETSELADKGLKKGLKMRPQSWPQSTDTRILSLLFFNELGRKDLSDKMGISFRAGLLKVSIARLMDDQLIEHTEAKENSRNQKYRLTKKARRLLLAL